MSQPAQPPQFTCRHSGEQIELSFSGDWLLSQACPPAQAIIDAVISVQSSLSQSPSPAVSSSQPSLSQPLSSQHTVVTLVAGDSLRWDSQLVSRIYHCQQQLRSKPMTLDTSKLPSGVQQLLSVAGAVAPAGQPIIENSGFFARLDLTAWLRVSKNEAKDFIHFVGQIAIACGRLIKGQTNTRWGDFFYFVQQAGPGAIGIITLVSVLVGMILAYLGLVQLKLFGAEIYVANLVTIGMVREMGALMTAVIMAGRTGAAYAAQLGTMQVNEEVDAITTLGISPIEFLVLPRMFALICMMPLLCLYSDVVGLVGGAMVASGMDITLNQYIAQSRDAITLLDVMTGLFKSLVFGVLIAIAGCKAGIQSGRNSAAVGEATTKAVVTATVYLVVADASLNIIYDKLGI